jgi:hypothetical protein
MQYIGDKLYFSAEYLNVLAKNQTSKKIGPFSASYIFGGRNFGPLATL